MNKPKSSTFQKINKREIGQLAENKACRYLEDRGLKLIKQNFNCRLGELDLIMSDKNDIVFVEVRYRARNDYGDPGESINFKKQIKIIKTAMLFLQKTGSLYKVNSRFDVVAIQQKNDEWQIDWIKNAFSARN